MKRRKRKDKGQIILGLTGSFGSGKTTVAGFFRGLGAQVVDADKIAHKYIARNSPVYKKIINSFGKAILSDGGIIDRRKLAAIVFSDECLLKKLNSIIHPQVIRDIKGGIKSSKSSVIVLDVPLLVESGLTKIIDKLIVVKITKDMQIKRIRRKFNLSKADILKRIKCQLPLRLKERLADFVIDNGGSITKTKSQVVKIWKNLQPHLYSGYKGGSCGKAGYR